MSQVAVSGDTLVLGIETSCDETAAALVRGGHDILSSVVSSQIELHAVFGGVVPEVASRAHLDLLNPVVARAIVEAGVDEREIDAVACTIGPGLIGALLVGVSAAKALALAWDVPFVGVNHLEAHLYASLLDDPTVEPPIVVLLVSGGHTMLVEMRAPGEYRLLGQTIDDAAGEAFDKVARYLGLGYPGGPAVERTASSGDPGAIAFPRAMRNDGLDFSFSGLKTSVVNYVRKHPEVAVADVAASFQQAVVDVLVEKARRAAAACGAKGIALGGGVAANSHVARGTGGGMRRGRVAVLRAEPGDVHRQRGDDRGRRLAPPPPRRPDPARRGRPPEPAPRRLIPPSSIGVLERTGVLGVRTGGLPTLRWGRAGGSGLAAGEDAVELGDHDRFDRRRRDTAPGEGLGRAIAGGERAEQQVLGPDEVVLQPQRFPQRRVEHRFGPLVEGQVGHRVGGLGGDVEGGGEVRLLHPELTERLGPERLGFGVLGDGEVLGTDRRRLRTAGETVRRDQHGSGAIGEAAEGTSGGDQAGTPPRDPPLLGGLLADAHRRADLAPRLARSPRLVDEVADQVVGLIVDVGGEAERLRQRIRASSGACW